MAWLKEQFETGALPPDPQLLRSLLAQAKRDPDLIARLVAQAKDSTGQDIFERMGEDDQDALMRTAQTGQEPRPAAADGEVAEVLGGAGSTTGRYPPPKSPGDRAQ